MRMHRPAAPTPRRQRGLCHRSSVFVASRPLALAPSCRVGSTGACGRRACARKPPVTETHGREIAHATTTHRRQPPTNYACTGTDPQTTARRRHCSPPRSSLPAASSTPCPAPPSALAAFALCAAKHRPERPLTAACSQRYDSEESQRRKRVRARKHAKHARTQV